MGAADPPAHLYDVLIRIGAPRSLLTLVGDKTGGPPVDCRGDAGAAGAWVQDALVGTAAEPLRAADHGGGGDGDRLRRAARSREEGRARAARRGADAGTLARVMQDLTERSPDVAIVAPQAPAQQWYALSYKRSLADHGDAGSELDSHAWKDCCARSGPERTWLFGFSQGACLASETFARTSLPVPGLIAIAGSRISPAEAPPIARSLEGKTVVLGAAREDPWLAQSDLSFTAEGFAKAGAHVTRLDANGNEHHIGAVQRLAARELLGTRGGAAPLCEGSGTRSSRKRCPGRCRSTRTRRDLRRTGSTVSTSAERASQRRVPTTASSGSTGSDRRRAASLCAARARDAHGRVGRRGPEPRGLAADRRARGSQDFVDGLVTLGGAGLAGNPPRYACTSTRRIVRWTIARSRTPTEICCSCRGTGASCC
jgi:phospholipase/carboxylesterase